MSERENQRGDPETAVCHVCDRRFDSQEALGRHLMDEHRGELLPTDPDPSELSSQDHPQD